MKGRRVKSASAAKTQTKTARRRGNEPLAAPRGRAAKVLAEANRGTPSLQDSAQFFHSALDGLSAHVAIVDRLGTILLVNRAWRNFAAANGLHEAGACEGASYLKICQGVVGSDAGTARDFARGLRSVLAGRRTQFELEYPCHSPREQRWFVGRVTRFPGAGPRRAIIAHENITTRKQAEESLRESEERYRRLIEVSPDAIFVNCRDRLVLINQAGLKLFGATRAQQMLGRSPFEFTHPDYHPLVRERLHQQLTLRKTVAPVDQRIIRLDGSVRTVEVAAAPVIYDGVLSVQAVLRDVTERKEAEDRLRHSEDSLAEAQTLASIGNWRVVYRNGAEEWSCSDELCRIWGYPAGAAITMQTGMDRLHPDDRGRTDELWAAALRVDGPREWEHRIVVDGKVKWIHAKIQVQRDATGQVLEVAGTNQDITKRKVAEEEVRVQQMALAHLSRVVTVGELASGIAHEVDQPLGASLLYAETCRDLLNLQRYDKPKLRRAMQSLIGQLERARKTVLRLREFVRKRPISQTQLDVNQVVRDAARVLTHELNKAQVQVAFRLSPEPVPLHGDAVLIEQVILNLIMNALNAMTGSRNGRNGLRRLTLGSTVGANGTCKVTVSDTGPGVADEVADRLFDSFVTTKPDGMGLGLTISRSIVERHGGKMWYEPAPVRGAVFCFTLPAS